MNNPTPTTEIRELPGCYVDASAQSANDCNTGIIDFAASYGFDIGEPLPSEDTEDYSEIISEMADDAVTWLNEYNETPFTYWTIEENSLFLVADVDGAREQVDFVSREDVDETTDPDDASYPRADFRGDWLRVSDHGNATLYARDADGKDVEIWSVV